MIFRCSFLSHFTAQCSCCSRQSHGTYHFPVARICAFTQSDSDSLMRLLTHLLPVHTRLSLHGKHRQTCCRHNRSVSIPEQFPVFQTENLLHCPDHAAVFYHTAGQKHWLSHRKLTHHGSLEVSHHRIGQPQKNILGGYALLLPMDQIGFRKDTASSCQPGNTGCPVGVVGVGFQRKSEAVHLVFKEGAGSRRALTVYRILQHLFPAQSRKKTGGLGTNFQNALSLRIQQLLSRQKGSHPVRHLLFSCFRKKESRSMIHCGIIDGSRIGMIQFLFHGFQHLTQGMLRISFVQLIAAVD